MISLHYRSFLEVDDLELNECTVHRCGDGTHLWWQLWFYVAQQTDGQPRAFCVPIIPNGEYTEVDGRKMWGATRVGDVIGWWRVSPSINVLVTREVQPGVHEEIGSLWHDTVQMVNVPDGERWTTEAP